MRIHRKTSDAHLEDRQLPQRSQVDSNAVNRDTRRLLTVQEAAQYLAVSVSTLYGWVWQRRVPFIKIGRALRFDPLDLAAFVNANKHGPGPEFS